MTPRGVKFDAAVQHGRPDQPRYVIVPASAVAALAITKTATVSGTIGDAAFTRQAVKPLGRTGEWFLDVTAAVAERANFDTGDVVAVTLQLESEECPADLAAAIAADPAAQAWWDGATAQKRRQMVNDVEKAKKLETRTARIDRWVQLISDWQRTTGRPRF